MELTPKKLMTIKPVRSLDIFDGLSGNLHEDGLFSISIFGKPGEELRDRRFSYIDIKIPVLHPIIYFTLTELKQLYKGVIEGREYAVWNPIINDFERSNPVDGSTGFHFFMTYWDKVDFGTKQSDIRQEQIEFIIKNKHLSLTDKIVVLPAGLRDVEVSETGRVRKDEINDLYASILSTANSISPIAYKTNPELLNNARLRLQNTFNQVYITLENMVKGKKKFFLNKWASRRIQNGTRNVITAMKLDNPVLGEEGAIGINHTIVGLYQMMKAALPITRYELRQFLSKFFISPDIAVDLVNQTSLKKEPERLSIRWYDRWTTDEGLDKVITSFSTEDTRHKPVIIQNKYLSLIYLGPDGSFKLLSDINELPSHLDSRYVGPLTWVQLFYIATAKRLNNLPGYVTRYPIQGIGSIYPSLAYVKTTTLGQARFALDDTWSKSDDYIYREFPTPNGAFVNSLSPHPSKLVGLGADYDGDTSSFNVVYSEEAIAEVMQFINDKRSYVGTDGRLIAPLDTYNVNLVLRNLTAFDPA